MVSSLGSSYADAPELEKPDFTHLFTILLGLKDN